MVSNKYISLESTNKGLGCIGQGISCKCSGRKRWCNLC